jgi:hypothetical protein
MVKMMSKFRAKKFLIKIEAVAGLVKALIFNDIFFNI